MKNVRMLVCVAGSAALLGMGCGPAEAPESAPEQQPATQEQAAYYPVCWSAVGVYSGPATTYQKLGTLYRDYNDFFETDSSVFWANGEYWVRGMGTSFASGYGYYGYARWAGLCH